MPPAFEHQHRVEFHETDMAGIVHFAHFFRYMETCEHAFLRSLGHPIHHTADGRETGWPRVSASCDFRAPARFDDVLTILLFVAEVRNRSVRYRFEIACDSTLVAEGTVTTAHVTLTPAGIEAVPIPAPLRSQLLAHQEPPPGGSQ